ncbi:hypothetical protein M405DRAFT_869303 [Rhizopogon salebrosus TDB-379]|nr:hypothetical protein M405DRAFT_869303 [Rhizopogon salebrosus TDB-379]
MIVGEEHRYRNLLDLVLKQDEEMVDVVLAIGLRLVPQDQLPGIISRFSHVAQSRAQDGAFSSILMDIQVPAQERPEIHDLFQFCLESDIQDFSAAVVKTVHQAVVEDPSSQMMLIPVKPCFHKSIAVSPADEDDEVLLLRRNPWHIPSL